MEIYLLRHGIAESRAPSDAERDLTEEGRQKVREVTRMAARAGVSPALVLSSPYRRALETAKIAGRGWRGRARARHPPGQPSA